ncbi:MAG TPA: DUF4286 family protein [Lacibacter sp.]|nr:DUF4286 family protein [Lacibacter sp.]HMO88170.1 DUF4286 family protein [Lacibacter sp.]HMP86935.1 DUF4286 family protein [Lacibacter sp.]
MFIYNVTVKVDWAIHDAWLQWMQEVHMPEVVATGCFISSRLLRLLESDEAEGPTYAAQYTAESKAVYNRYIDSFAEELRRKAFEKWGNRFIAFRSLMQVVD